LAEYPILSPLPGSKEAASELEAGNGCDGDTLPSKRFSAKVMDISAFLAVAEGWDEIKLAPLAHKIAVHEPCSLRNVLRGSAFSYTLLARIPSAQVAPLAGNDQCCGAAGIYFLDQPEMAKVLLHDKIIAINASGARYLATSNVGCAMHLASALREGGSEIEVLHPVTLIARQMNINSEI
jgi:glycolate oxidase iron-sulfur subunit